MISFDARLAIATALALIAAPSPVSSQEVALGDRSIAEVAARLKPGEYAWTPDAAPAGLRLLVDQLHDSDSTSRSISSTVRFSVTATSSASSRPS